MAMPLQWCIGMAGWQLLGNIYFLEKRDDTFLYFMMARVLMAKFIAQQMAVN